MNERTRHLLAGMLIGASTLLAASAGAQETLVDTVAKGCEKELKEFCVKVTPGEGRILACLYAYQDKLSARCEYALYDAGAQLEHAVATLSYLTNECGDDLKKHCGAIKPGEGRVIDCMKKNEKALSRRCSQAIKDTGAKFR
jgi:Cysteine rich repeat